MANDGPGEGVIKIVKDEACPTCGAIWGHDDPALNFANRPKVGDEDGTWWWRCYNPGCETSWYDPNTGRVEGDGNED